MVAALHGLVASNIYDWPIVRNADLFVDFFFVLSGFVIAYGYLDRITTPRRAIGFMVRRVGRLWPLHAVTFLAVLSLIAMRLIATYLGFYDWHFDQDPGAFTRFTVESLFLLHAFRDTTLYWLNFPSWSISAEIWAYAAFSALILLPLRSLWLVGAAIASYAAVIGLIDPPFGGFFGQGLFRAISFFILGTAT